MAPPRISGTSTMLSIPGHNFQGVLTKLIPRCLHLHPFWTDAELEREGEHFCVHCAMTMLHETPRMIDPSTLSWVLLSRNPGAILFILRIGKALPWKFSEKKTWIWEKIICINVLMSGCPLLWRIIHLGSKLSVLTDSLRPLLVQWWSHCHKVFT